MKIGKIPNDILENLIYDMNNDRQEVIVGSAIGRDTAILDFKEKLLVVSTDPITGTTKDIGSLALNVAVNDLATEGAEPVGATVTILIPPDTDLNVLESIMDEIKTTSKKLNIAIVGGHTEVTDAVNRVVISTTVLGSIDRPYVQEEVLLNDLVVVTKSLGIEGTSIIAKEKEAELKHTLTSAEFNEAISYHDDISVVKDGLLAKKHGAKYMHDITEGGLLGAVWESAKAINKGMVIFKNRLPVTKVTEKLATKFDIDPLKLISSGSMLMIISQKDYIGLLKDYETHGIKSTVIGKITEFDGAYLNIDDEIKEIAQPKSDELYKVLY